MQNCFTKGDALLIVDVQQDFFPGGALGVPAGLEIVDVVNEWLRAASKSNIPIFASRDWHPPNHCSFKEQGGIWPIHCIQNTQGADFHPQVIFPENVTVINKATDPLKEVYSAFQGQVSNSDKSLEQTLRDQQVKRIWLMGLALDFCVVETALEAREKGFEVHVLLKGTKAITENTGRQAMDRMQKAGVILE